MRYIKLILTIIAILLLIITWKLLNNPYDVNLKLIGNRHIEFAEPIKVIIVDR